LNIEISQGSAATDMTWGGSVYYFCPSRSLSLNAKVNKLLKSDHICQSYR